MFTHHAHRQADLAIQLLGGFAVTRGGEPIPDRTWRLQKARGIVKLLALTPEHTMPREQAQEMLWPALPPEAAANSLYKALHAARRALAAAGRHEAPSAYLTLQGGLLTLAAPGTLHVDVAVFVARAQAALRTGSLPALEEAWSLYTGDLLPDDPYEDWTLAPREHLQALRSRVGQRLALGYEAEGEVAAATALARQLVAHDPTDEEAQACLMRLLAGSGERIAALRQYQRLCHALATELGVAPAPALQALYEQLRRGHDVPPGAQGSTERAGQERYRTPWGGSSGAHRPPSAG